MHSLRNCHYVVATMCIPLRNVCHSVNPATERWLSGDVRCPCQDRCACSQKDRCECAGYSLTEIALMHGTQYYHLSILEANAPMAPALSITTHARHVMITVTTVVPLSVDVHMTLSSSLVVIHELL